LFLHQPRDAWIQFPWQLRRRLQLRLRCLAGHLGAIIVAVDALLRTLGGRVQTHLQRLLRETNRAEPVCPLTVCTWEENLSRSACVTDSCDDEFGPHSPRPSESATFSSQLAYARPKAVSYRERDRRAGSISRLSTCPNRVCEPAVRAWVLRETLRRTVHNGWTRILLKKDLLSPVI